MKDIDKDFWGGLCVICILLAAVLICLDAVAGYVPQPSHEPREWPPQIQKCDKELWLRVKDGCDEQNSDN